ncbi:MAG: 2-dehydropantoate 2-reductase [Burkholderiaceae bacterium]|nr:2-dehydropantoate 2-reductase [Burkholderiaceae bacterium]
MKVCVLGAGAVGSWLAAKLAMTGEDVTLVARGEQFAAIDANGIELDEGKFGKTTARVSRLVRDLASAEGCDVVVVALKAYQLAAVADQLGHLASRGAFILSLQNGFPWWYFQGVVTQKSVTHLESVDPGGKLFKALPQGTVVGGVAYVAAEVTKPGQVKVAGKGRLVMGEPDGQDSGRLQELAALLQRCGIAAEPVMDIRCHVWAKLWRNAAFNPVSCVTRATLGGIAADAGMAPVLEALLDEVAQVAAAFGISINESATDLISSSIRFGMHKTSMLQDLERGRSLELDAMVGAVIELAGSAGIRVPHLNTVFVCARLAEKSARVSVN